MNIRLFLPVLSIPFKFSEEERTCYSLFALLLAGRIATLKRLPLPFESEFSYLKAGVDYSVPLCILSIYSFGIECFLCENFDVFIVAEAGCSECRSWA